MGSGDMPQQGGARRVHQSTPFSPRGRALALTALPARLWAQPRCCFEERSPNPTGGQAALRKLERTDMERRRADQPITHR
jgi:hypothetical protein